METNLVAAAKTAELVELTEDQKLDQTAQSIEANAREIAVVDNESYVKAGQFELNCKAFIKEALAYYKPRKEERRSAWQDMLDREKAVVGRVETAMESVGRLCKAWENEQERKRKEAEQAAQAAINKRAEDDALAVAQALEAVGETELAQKIVADVAPETVVLPSFVPEVKGIGTRKNWRWRVKSGEAVKRQFLKLDDVKINALVRTQGKAAEKMVGGIEVYADDSRVRRTR